MISELTKLAELKITQKLGQDIIENLSAHQRSEPRGNYINYATKVIRPKNTNEVSVILSTLNELDVKVIPYCGGTGLVGGQMAPSSDFLLLSLDRMNSIRDVSAQDGTLTVESGMILSNVQDEAKKIDRVFPLSLASEGSCQIGGNLATNAGGINVIKFGNARNLCLGVEAVLANGTIYNGLGSLIKDNTGYDLKNLLIGSEGTLGVITAATLKTFPLPDEIVVSMLKVESPNDAIILLRELEKTLGDQLQAFELINKIGLVAGDEWHGGNLSYHLKSRPKWDNILENTKNPLLKKFEGGFILIGDVNTLSKICSGVFFEVEKQGVCMVGKRK